MSRFTLLVACAALLALVTPDVSHGIPRYSARYRQNCNLCHHNPTGGGMRSLYASKYIVPTEMVLKTIRDEALESIRPDVSESITIGTDIRTIHHWANEERGFPELNFFQMQADVYLRFQVDARYSAYLDRGRTETREVFGLGYVLPWNGYFKFGRFTPAYGWKWADHRQFVREGRTGDGLQDLFFEPPFHTDVGVEVGMYPGRFSLIASLFNGAPGSSGDFDDNLGHMVRAAYRFDVGPAGLALGGSWAHNRNPSGVRTAGGPFWYVNVGRLTWLGEADITNEDPARNRPSFVSGNTRTAILTSHELAWQLVTGVDLRAVYNYADPDIDHATGHRTKVGGGVDALVTPFFGVKGMVHYYQNKAQNGTESDVTDLNYTQTELTLHLFY